MPSTIMLTDAEHLVAQRMAAQIDAIQRDISRNILPRREYDIIRNRRSRERKRMVETPCTECAIMSTCEKRKAHGLSSCKYAIVQTNAGLQAQCSVHVARSKSSKKALAKRKRRADGTLV